VSDQWTTDNAEPQTDEVAASTDAAELEQPGTDSVDDSVDTDSSAAADAEEGALDEGADEGADDTDAPAGVSFSDTDEAAGEPAVTDEPDIDAPPADPVKEFKDALASKFGDWYVVHSYAGYENRVKANLENRTTSLNMEDYIFEAQVPMEEVTEIKNGQKKLVKRVRMPGYVLVRMDLTDESWGAVRHTPGVTGFVGNAHNPTPLRFEEAFSMLKSLVQVEAAPAKGAAKGQKSAARTVITEVDFEIGETITIKEGSFAGLPGSISEIKPESGKLTVLVSLFERETPVELSFDQVTKQ